MRGNSIAEGEKIEKGNKESQRKKRGEKDEGEGVSGV